MVQNLWKWSPSMPFKHRTGEDCIRQFLPLSVTDNMKWCQIYKLIGQLVSLVVKWLQVKSNTWRHWRDSKMCYVIPVFTWDHPSWLWPVLATLRPWGRPRKCWIDYISYLVWDHVRICQEVLEYVALESYLHNTAATVTQISAKNGWMNLHDARLA